MPVRSLGLTVLLLGVLGSIASASMQKDLDSAAKKGKIVFILVTDKGATGVAQAKEVIQQTMGQLRESTLIELDRSDPANAEYVAKFGLAGVPVPLILLAARNGALAGGMPAAQATPPLLVAMVPSPKKAEVLKALQAGKSVFISASRKSMTAKSGAAATCATACGQMADKCAMVEIDMDDPQEAIFLGQIKVNLASIEPVTLVVNAKGQVTGTYTGAVEVASLVQAATKVMGGCCPSTVQGGSKTCAPTPKP